MEIDIKDVLSILGEFEVQRRILMRRVAELEKAVSEAEEFGPGAGFEKDRESTPTGAPRPNVGRASSQAARVAREVHP